MNVGRKDNEEAEFPGQVRRCCRWATMIVKVIGMFFKIPLNRLIGEANYGYFTTAYDIYTVLLMISTTGLPSP